MAAATRTPFASIKDPRSTPSSTTATATRCTSRIPISWRRTRRRHSSCRMTIMKWTTTTPATWMSRARRPSCSCCVARPRTRRTSRRCRFAAAPLPTGSSMRLYRRIQFGGLIDLSVLDTRQYRSKQACGGGSKTDCAEALDREADDPRRRAQEKWLFENLAAAQEHAGPCSRSRCRPLPATFELSNPAGRFSMDKWDGYVGARATGCMRG